MGAWTARQTRDRYDRHVRRAQLSVDSGAPVHRLAFQVAHGMYVQLYSSGVLTAEAVVSDLDSTRVRATVTQVHQTGIALQANDVAHFSPQAPVAVELRAFDK